MKRPVFSNLWNPIRGLTLSFISLLWFVCAAVSAPVDTHPHIIVTEPEFAQLRARSGKWPWSAMKEKAIHDATNLSFPRTEEVAPPTGRDKPIAAYELDCYRIQDIVSACALAYILDPDHKSIYLRKMETEVAGGMNYLRAEKEKQGPGGGGHLYSVRPASTAFMTYIALDIMHHDLSESVRKAMEEDCDYIADHHKPSWRESRYAIEGMKELYHQGNTKLFEEKKKAYRNYILKETSESGVFAAGPGYTRSRLYMDKRIQKKAFMDVCEVQGYHEFYSEPKFQVLYEWVFGYVMTPFGKSYTFGDTPPTKEFDHWSVAALRANRFSEKAQRYAAHTIGTYRDEFVKGRLLHYLLCDVAPLDAESPPSRIFKDGGAWLMEDADSDRALAVALWNLNMHPVSHAHKDVNAIHIAAYGEHIFRNSGYDGWANGEWKWIHNTAESSNVVLINGVDHVDKQGAGITEGFVGCDIEYASGSSGKALPNGHHQRNVVFVKPRDGKSGYFILIDEVHATDASASVNVVLHPNSASDPVVVAEKQTYQWNIEGCNYSGHPVQSTVFQGTPPESVEIKVGYKGSYSNCSQFYGKYLYATYPTDEQGQAGIVSVIFPHDDAHPVAGMTRVSLPEASGVALDHGDGVMDTVLSASQLEEVTREGVCFEGMATVYRQVAGSLQTYFIRKGTKFNDGASERRGFESDAEVSLFMNDKLGRIISAGANVKFFCSGITAVNIDGNPAPLTGSGAGWLEVHVASGSHTIQLVVRSR
ncbi:heparinase II/III domain-containing protein [Pontiella sulfatireligans]|nr:heparinase II/III family protein [Pontiella sulfatireligans]